MRRFLLMLALLIVPGTASAQIPGPRAVQFRLPSQLNGIRSATSAD